MFVVVIAAYRASSYSTSSENTFPRNEENGPSYQFTMIGYHFRWCIVDRAGRTWAICTTIFGFLITFIKLAPAILSLSLTYTTTRAHTDGHWTLHTIFESMGLNGGHSKSFLERKMHFHSAFVKFAQHITTCNSFPHTAILRR